MTWMDNTIACAVTIHTWGNAKGVKAAALSAYSEDLAEKAADKRVSMRKKLLACPALAAIQSLDGEAQRWMSSRAVPSLLKHGVYAVPVPLVERWDDYLQGYQMTRGNRINIFLAVYNEATRNAQALLGTLYNPFDYPDVVTVREKFSVEVRYVDLGVPGRLQVISPAVFQSAQARLATLVEEGQAHIEALLCEELNLLVHDLMGALVGLNDDTPKRFHKSHLDKLAEWTALFVDVRNVTGFQELEAVAQRLHDTVQGLKPESIKQFGTIRAELHTELAHAQVTLKGLMEDRPRRRFVLD